MKRAAGILFGVAVVLVLTLTSGAATAHSGGIVIKALCASSPPASRTKGPAAHCDAWAQLSSAGKLVPHARPSRAARAALAKPNTTPTASASPNTSGTVQFLWPNELNTVYALPVSSSVSGAKTVAIVDAWGDVNIRADLAQMDSDFFPEYGTFPACSLSVTTSCFQVVNQTGGTSLPTCPQNPPGMDGDVNDCTGWAVETALDVETVHTVCRNCKIVLVEANSDFSSDLAAAEDEAVALGANIVSNSYGAAEGGSNGLQQSDFDTFAPHYIHNGVLAVASTGDDAFASGTQFPADINSVVSVGGTTLSTIGDSPDDDGVAYASESAWFTPGSPPEGAGSGCSIFQAPQAWQSSANGWSATGCGTERAVADVSADASPDSGLAVWITDPLVGCSPPFCYFPIGGTSLAAPIIAATYALASNPGSVANVQSLPYAHFRDLHDITTGSTGSCGRTICRAAVGYDGPTGMGTPNGLSGFQIGAPSIGSFSPVGGPPGTTVTITGQNFTQATAVTIGGTPVQSFHVDSDVQITAVAGNGTSGLISVTTPGGTATNGGEPAFEFTSIVSSFTPKGGGAGTSVTITGSGFTGATAVTFGGTPAASFNVVSDTEITAVTASGTNTGPIAVTTPGGTGTSSTNFFGPPSINEVNVGHAAVHSTVTVDGTNLSGATHVTLNGTAAAFTVVSVNQIRFTVPTGATTGTIQVTTPGGSATSGTFTVDPGPAITSFSPGTGTVGETITITGTNLDGTVGVKLGSIITVPTSVSSTQVTFTIPPGAVSGTITLLATGGTASSATPLTVTG